MRHIITVYAILLLSAAQACTEATAGQQQDVVKNITVALGKGDAAGVAKFFPKSVGLAILQKTPVYYSQAQAKQILSDFFAKNKVHKFAKAHSGGQGGAQFTMGDLSTSTGVYRVTFFLKNLGGKTVIKNLIIDKK